MQNTWKVVGIIALIVLGVLLLCGMGMMGFGMMGPGMMHFGGASDFGALPFLGFLSLGYRLLVLAGIVFLIVWLVRTYGGRMTASAAPQSPFDILKTRYAKGEITKE